jgi:hypothetical protein
MAYAVKTLIVFSSCYRGICPETQTGIYLMLLSVVLLLLTSVFPSGTIKKA